MDPAALGIRIASGVVSPLIRKLFARPGPGADLVDAPVRVDGLVSFRGERRHLAEEDVRALVTELVRRAVRAGEHGERPLPRDEEETVVGALTGTLLTLGTLTLTDVEAVSLGHQELAIRLRRAGGDPARHLSADAAYFYERLLTTACLHVLNFFTQRSAFVARTLVEQSRNQAELIVKVDELIARNPLPDSVDVRFEQRYLAHVTKKHGKLTIFGIDLADSPGKWPLDAAYLSLTASGEGRPLGHVRIGDDWHTVLEADLDAPPRPADEALAAHDRVLLRGEAGSGKTTLVQWLAVSAATAHPEARMAYLRDHIPYVLPLRTLTAHGERLPAPRDFLTAVSPLAGTQPDGWEARVLTAGRALVLVDGIDEVPEAERARTRAWLTDLMDAYPGNRWLVTSRPSAVREDWLADEGFTELTLAPMSAADVATFIARWHTAAATGAPEEDAALAAYRTQLLEAVRTKHDLGRLATNPLLCGLICALHRDRRGFLPLGRKDLYTAALSMLLLRRDRERHMDVPELREEPQLQLLQRLAYWLIRNGRTEMDRTRATTIIRDALPAVPELASLGDADAVYAHFLHRSGLLREPGPDSVQFVHRSFQDFLGARAAVDEGDFGVLARHAADDQWEDVIRMAVAQARPRERAELLSDLLAYGDAHPDSSARKRAHLLAATCLEHAAELVPAVREAVERRTAGLIPPQGPDEARELAAAGPMVLELLPGPEDVSGVTARHVVIAATHVHSDTAIPFLARYVDHPDQAVRSQLMWGWHRFDSRVYADQIVSRLDDGSTHFTLHTDEHVDEVLRLGLRPTLLDIRDGVSPEAASRLIAECAPTYLLLMMSPALLTRDALAALSRLEALRLIEVREPWNFDQIPVEAPLHTLDLILTPGLEDRDLTLIGRWPGLRTLTFRNVNEFPSSEAAWRNLSRLRHLTSLTVPIDSLAHAPADISLPGITDLTLFSTRTGEPTSATVLARARSLFPSVESQVTTGRGPEQHGS
ncbi:NACHT domain-containing protein [Streptomyces sp. p1417]|uniref:NACHT domain-containing protein n=1 Tax=Streptomyces typhae TaxID=2681492 RepID=A0A6L6WZ15_9ACTN|nr:NACHT domain-containing protein [Streptomyces typhae]MVO86755.1 NACHT domain-containing protein [Streptomyces typhae]